MWMINGFNYHTYAYLYLEWEEGILLCGIITNPDVAITVFTYPHKA